MDGVVAQSGLDEARGEDWSDPRLVEEDTRELALFHDVETDTGAPVLSEGRGWPQSVTDALMRSDSRYGVAREVQERCRRTLRDVPPAHGDFLRFVLRSIPCRLRQLSRPRAWMKRTHRLRKAASVDSTLLMVPLFEDIVRDVHEHWPEYDTMIARALSPQRALESARARARARRRRLAATYEPLQVSGPKTLFHLSRLLNGTAEGQNGQQRSMTNSEAIQSVLVEPADELPSQFKNEKKAIRAFEAAATDAFGRGPVEQMRLLDTAEDGPLAWGSADDGFNVFNLGCLQPEEWSSHHRRLGGRPPPQIDAAAWDALQDRIRRRVARERRGLRCETGEEVQE
jgi:hypothetical protein